MANDRQFNTEVFNSTKKARWLNAIETAILLTLLSVMVTMIKGTDFVSYKMLAVILVSAIGGSIIGFGWDSTPYYSYMFSDYITYEEIDEYRKNKAQELRNQIDSRDRETNRWITEEKDSLWKKISEYTN